MAEVSQWLPLLQQSTLLQSRWQHSQAHFQQVASDEQLNRLTHLCDQSAGFTAQLQLLWSCSDYVADFACRQVDAFLSLLDSGDLHRRYPERHLQEHYRTVLADLDSEEALASQLRQLRNREMVRIVWRDFTDLADLEETTADMSALAAVSLDSALEYLYPKLCQRYGTPTGENTGQPQQLVVLGMGKLGAGELNVSSDIDLIFAYPENGETQTEGTSVRRSRSNQEFFDRLGRQLIQMLDDRTADGFVFRVDMRLRPYGGSGPLVGSFDALEQYYQTQGRDWERFALVKARPIAGDRQAGEQLLTMLKPFIYRKYIDYSAIEALRDIKALIEQEVNRTGAHNDVKRGYGGIREVEFIAQACQLIRGGRDSRLQRPPLLEVLPLLEQENLLPAGKAAELIRCYKQLRSVEHILQGIADQQTQSLPEDELGQTRLAVLSGSSDWAHFSEHLQQCRATVAEEFSAVVAIQQSDSDKKNLASESWAVDVWQRARRGRSVAELLEQAGYDQPDNSQQQLQALLACHAVQQMQSTARSRIDSFIPILLVGCRRQQQSSQVLQRILALVEAVARRSAYLLLLVENPQALQQLLQLCAASPWIAQQLARHPALLDELLDARTLYSQRDKSMLADELRQLLLRIPEQDIEAQLEALRYFKRSNRLRVAACEVTDALPLMKVSDNLTWIAEVVLEQVLELAWRQMTERFGLPGGVADSAEKSFLIVGYGKLGGIELGHSSDLDLVFLYDADPNQRSNGERSIDNTTFYLRLGQRIIHLLTTQTSLGQLYEVDMRLRPSGNSGMLVTSLAGFERYQREDAWTWEHQALVRARPVAGSAELAQQFTQVRRKALAVARDHSRLVDEVCDMRRKMASHLSDDSGEYFDLKQGQGGIVDIEFMVQFVVLAWSHRYPELLRWSDNIRILESAAQCGDLSDTLSQVEISQLIDTYQNYRTVGHQAQLQQQRSTVAIEQFIVERQQVSALWQRLLKSY